MSTFKIKTMKNIVTKLIENLQEKKRQTLMVSDTIIDIQKRERTTQHNTTRSIVAVMLVCELPLQNKIQVENRRTFLYYILLIIINKTMKPPNKNLQTSRLQFQFFEEKDAGWFRTLKHLT